MTDESQPAAPAGQAESFGSWLRGQREVRQVELETISQSSKINIRYLEALEQDRFDQLPATIFVRGFLREYARVVGLDPDEVLNFYIEASDRDDAEGGIGKQKKRSSRRSLVWIVLAVLFAAAIAAFFLWRHFYGPEREAAVRTEPMAPPLTEEAPPPPPTEPLPERALRVTLEFRAKSWVEVHGDGERTVNELRVESESLTVTADREIRLRLGNADAAAIEVNGEPFEHDAGDNEEIVITAPWPGQPDAEA